MTPRILKPVIIEAKNRFLRVRVRMSIEKKRRVIRAGSAEMLVLNEGEMRDPVMICKETVSPMASQTCLVIRPGKARSYKANIKQAIIINKIQENSRFGSVRMSIPPFNFLIRKNRVKVFRDEPG